MSVTTRSRLTLGLGAAVMVACVLMTTPACSHVWACLVRSAHRELAGSSIRVAVFAFVLLTWLAWVVRLCHLILRTRYLVGRLPIGTCPSKLQAAAERTSVGQVFCIESTAKLAFCCGAGRPRIYLSAGLVSGLRECEVDAVLLHELHHRRRRDPLRYASVVALKDVCFYIPLLDWLAQFQRENAELRADRAVMRTLGPRPLAGALATLSTASAPALVAAFHGATELRAAQILGDRLPARRPGPGLWVASTLGAVAVLFSVNCVFQLASLG